MSSVIASTDLALIARWRSALLDQGTLRVIQKHDALAQLQSRMPRFLVIDLQLFPALPSSKDLSWLFSACAVCLLNPTFSIDEELRWLASGVRACCTPDLDDERLKTIVDVTARGGIWVSKQSLPVLLQGLQHFTAPPTAPVVVSPSKLIALTPQEKKIAQLVGQGQSNKLIARALNISDHTVKAHLSAIFSKLHLTDRVHLALLVTQDSAGMEAE
jgi:two-component system nitrate/nitrite response regulator NarL